MLPVMCPEMLINDNIIGTKAIEIKWQNFEQDV